MQDIHDAAAVRSRAILTTAVIFLVLPLIVVLLRCFSRLRLVKGFGWDDTTMAIALLFNTLFTIFAILGPLHGVGRRMQDFTNLDDFKKSLFFWWIAQPVYIFSCIFMKISIAITLLRLTVYRWHRYLLYAVMVITVIFGLAMWLLMTLQCKPVSEFWMRTGNGKCLNPDPLIVMFYVYGSIGAACDLCLAVLPVFLVYKLQVKKQVKVMLCVILSLGGVACVSSIVRLPFISMYKGKDTLYSSYLFIILFIVESGLGIISGSLPTLRPLFRWLHDGVVSTVSSIRGRKSRATYISSFGEHRESLRPPNGGAGYWQFDSEPINLTRITVGNSSSTKHVGSSSQEILNPAVIRKT